MSGCTRFLSGTVARTLLGSAISAVFIVLFLRNTEFSGVADAFREVDIALILSGIGIYFIGIYFRAWRWHYLLRPIKAVPAYKLFPIVAIGFGTNNVLPFRTGEVVRAHVLNRRHGVSRAAGLSSIFLARVFDGMMLTIFLCVGVAASLVSFQGMAYAGDVLLAGMGFLIFGVSAAFVLLYGIATHPDTAERVTRRLLAGIPFLQARGGGWIAALISGIGAVPDRRLFTAAVWTSAVAWGLEAFTYYLVGEGFGLDQPFPVYLLIAAAANIIISAPSTAGGVGPFEWATKEVLLIYLVTANAAGVAPEERAIAYAAALHGLILIPIAIVGLISLWFFHVPLGRLVRGREIPPGDAAGQPEPQPR